jgi:hypothetical protein
MVNLIKPSERFHQQIEPALDEYDPLSERLANGLARAIAVLSGHAGLRRSRAIIVLASMPQTIQIPHRSSLLLGCADNN